MGSAGGVLQLVQSTGEVVTHTYLQGLARGAVTAAMHDAAGDLWFGTAGGGLSRYRRDASRFDAALTAFADLNVHALLADGDNLYVGTDRGISLVSLHNHRVQSSFRQLGLLARDTPVRALRRYNNELWAATDQGVARARIDGANLQDPDNWQADESLGRIAALAIQGDSLFAAGTTGVWRLDGTSWRSAGGPTDAVALMPSAGGLVVAAGRAVYEQIDAQRWQSIWRTQGEARALATSAGQIHVGTAEGIEIVGRGALPVDSPPANAFYDLSLAASGTLWVATVPNDRSGVPRGVLSLATATGRWQQIDTSDGLHDNTVVSVQTGADGTLWAASWGAGLAARTTRNVWGLLNETNSPLRGLQEPSAPSFVVVPDIAVDEAGRVWVTNTQAGLVVLSGYPLQRGARFEATALGLPPNPGVGPLAIDDGQRKWIGTAGHGLVLFDDNDSPYQASDDRATLVNTLSDVRLTSDNITALAVDGSVLWVGTDNGLHRIVYEYDRQAGLGIRRWRSYRLEHGLESMSIRDLLVDNLGNVWAATGEGVTQLRTSGALVHTFTAGNSPLADDGVHALAFDDDASTLWIGTEAGLSELRIAGTSGSPGATAQLTAYPNPFNPNATAGLRFSGLALGSGLRLFAVDGTLVARIDGAPDGTAMWDGRTQLGEAVAEGVYFYVSDDGRFHGKVALLRRELR